MGMFSVGRKELVGDCFGQSPASSCLIPTLSGQSLGTNDRRLSTGEPTFSTVRRWVSLSAWS